jgi:glycosyltransferase involved in cell wall biosynthesis
VPELVRAFAVLAAADPELQLVLAGRPAWGAAEAAAAVGKSGVADRVVMTGYVGDSAVPALLRGAAVVVYPARQEGFGLPALEALACGAPLVTTAGTAMAEMAGDAALLVPPGRVDLLAEAIDTALRSGASAEQRRRVGLERAAEHTWAQSADGHVAAYRWAAERAADFEHRETPR